MSAALSVVLIALFPSLLIAGRYDACRHFNLKIDLFFSFPLSR